MGTITAVVRPGDAAPGGGVFDSARASTISNNAGDIAFSGHNASLPKMHQHWRAPSSAAKSVYLNATPPPGPSLRWPSRATPRPAARHTDSPSTTGSTLGVMSPSSGMSPRVRTSVWMSVITFTAARRVRQSLSPSPAIRCRRGHFVRAITYSTGNLDLNNRGDVTFGAQARHGRQRRWSARHGGLPLVNGTLSLIARSGTVIPGVGTIAQLRMKHATGNWGSGAMSNDRGARSSSRRRCRTAPGCY